MTAGTRQTALTAVTYLQKAVALLRFEADDPHEAIQWLAGYEAEALLAAVLSEAWSLAPLLNLESDSEYGVEADFDRLERAAESVAARLRAHRLAHRLSNVSGRTPEEAATFLAKAERLRAEHHLPVKKT